MNHFIPITLENMSTLKEEQLNTFLEVFEGDHPDHQYVCANIANNELLILHASVDEMDLIESTTMKVLSTAYSINHIKLNWFRINDFKRTIELAKKYDEYDGTLITPNNIKMLKDSLLNLIIYTIGQYERSIRTQSHEEAHLVIYLLFERSKTDDIIDCDKDYIVGGYEVVGDNARLFIISRVDEMWILDWVPFCLLKNNLCTFNSIFQHIIENGECFHSDTFICNIETGDKNE